MSDEGEKTCPLCAEEMDLTDQQLKPCKCGYDICVWCWHHIMDMAEKDDSEGRCPACRIPYDKEKIVGMAASCERMMAGSMEKKKSQKTRTKSSDGRKQLNSVRVIQRNLVYIVGLPLNFADEDLLHRREYFGQYGKVLKASMSRTTAGVIQQFPNNTCSVYITYSKEEEAIRCIQSVHGFLCDGKPLKACFGTTKYCHAWLRNVPCTNPDCLYLHEVGSHEDSFTKDEIISAYTRVQQITGTTNNNMLRRSGSMLPPPIDDYCSNNPASAAKPIVKSTSNHNPTSTGRGSPPNGSIPRSITLPAAASWGMRALNQSPVSCAPCSNGPHKPDTVSGTSAFSSAVSSTSQASMLQSDTGKGAAWDEEGQDMNGKVKADPLKTIKQQVSVDCRANILEKPANEPTATTISSDKPSPLTSNYNDREPNVVRSSTDSSSQIGESCGLEKEGIVETNGEIQNSCSDPSSVDSNIRSEPSAFRTNSSFSDHGIVKSHGNQVFQQVHPVHSREPLSSASDKSDSSANFVPAITERNLRTDSQTHDVPNTVSELEEDIISFDNQRLKDPEVVSRTTYLPNSANSVHVSNHSRSHSSQHNEVYGSVNLNGDQMFVDNFGVRSLLHPSSNSLMPNGYPENLNSSSVSLDRNLGRSFLLPNEGEGMHMGRMQDNGVGMHMGRLQDNGVGMRMGRMQDNGVGMYMGRLQDNGVGMHMGRMQDNGVVGMHMGRLQDNGGSNSTLAVGESSIISNILSLELDSWDDSLTSPHNLAKLLGETDKQPSPLKMSNSWKANNNNINQSRFSFARHEEPRNQVQDMEPSYNALGQLNNRSYGPDFAENRNSYFDRFGGIGNGFSSSNYEESGSFNGHRNTSILPSSRSSVSRAQVSAPPGFSMPNRAPPPGFSSHERMDQTYESLSGNHFRDSSSLLRNSPQAPPAANYGSTGDIEFMDPAILAVGKGRLQGGLNNPVLDMRMNIPQHLSAYENNDARLQLLMQRSLTQHPNLRYPDVGENFSSLGGDSYGISSRLDQAHGNNMSPYGQLPLQNSRNGLLSNGQWDGWHDVQGGGNSAGMAELLRNDSLGFNKFYPSGYEDSKYRMPSSGDLYNRTF